jgi:hypothetical protein
MSVLFDLQGRYMRDTTESDRREIRMYGTTVDQMRECVEESLTYRFSGAVMYVMSLMSDAQEMVNYGPYDSDTLANILEDQRQLLNRAKWVLSTYTMTSEQS